MTLNLHDLKEPKILVVAMSGIGNLLMQTPVLRQIKSDFPSAQISVLVAPRGTKEVLKHNPFVNTIFYGSPKPSFRQWLGMVSTIQKNKFDVGMVTFPGQLTTSSSILYFGSVSHRIGHKYNYYFLKNTDLFLNETIETENNIHDVVQNLNLLKLLGLSPDHRNAFYDFPLGNDDILEAEKFLKETDLLDQKLIGLHPGTNEDLVYKRWPIDRWAKLADDLSSIYKAKILIFGGAEENKLKREIKKKMTKGSFPVTLSLRGTAALIKKCSFFVSNDSGLMHTSVSQQIPTFGLFGPTDERRTGPWGTFGHVIRAQGTTPNYDIKHLRTIKKQKMSDSSMLAISKEKVLEEIRNLIPI